MSLIYPRIMASFRDLASDMFEDTRLGNLDLTTVGAVLCRLLLVSDSVDHDGTDGRPRP